MAASFGEQLRRAREARGISLREISEQTRISMRYLEAIEADDYKRLPGGIFNRSFIKAYARQIGFDEKEALEGYARVAREQGTPSDEDVTTVHPPRVYTDGNSARSPFVTLLLTILILAFFSLGVYAILHWYQRREAARTNDQTPRSQNTQAAVNPNAASDNVSATAPPLPPAAASALNVQIKAVGDRVWVRARPGEGAATETILAPNQTLEFKPDQSLRLQYAKIKAQSLEVTINGRPAKVPAESKGNLAEMVITKENYEQLWQ